MKEQSLGKLKANLILIFHLSSTHLGEPFFHERVYKWAKFTSKDSFVVVATI